MGVGGAQQNFIESSQYRFQKVNFTCELSGLNHDYLTIKENLRLLKCSSHDFLLPLRTPVVKGEVRWLNYYSYHFSIFKLFQGLLDAPWLLYDL